MSAPVVLGIKPGPLEVYMDSLADFTAELFYGIESGGTVTPTDWPVGTVVTLVFDNGVTWTATIVDDVATFQVDKAVVAAMPETAKVKLVYTNGTTDRVIRAGMAQRNG